MKKIKNNLVALLAVSGLFNISFADASNASGLPSFAVMLIVFVGMYFVLIRPQNKRAKEHQQLVQNLAVGDEVIISGGLMGKIMKITEQVISLELSEGVQVKCQRQSVLMMIPNGTLKTI